MLIDRTQANTEKSSRPARKRWILLLKMKRQGGEEEKKKRYHTEPTKGDFKYIFFFGECKQAEIGKLVMATCTTTV